MSDKSSPTAFSGFGAGKVKTVRIPEPFFSDLLPLIDDLYELKLTIYCFWALQQREGDFRYIRRRDLLADQALLAGLGENPEAALIDALAAAVKRGTLLEVTLPAPQSETVYFMNTEKGRRAVEALERGDWTPGDAHQPVALVNSQPNVYALYEQNIGPLTPLLAETLRDAEKNYPAEWFSEAFRLAVEANKRSWRYVEAILKRWLVEGKSAPSKPENNTAPDHPYLQDEYFKRRKRQDEA